MCFFNTIQFCKLLGPTHSNSVGMWAADSEGDSAAFYHCKRLGHSDIGGCT